MLLEHESGGVTTTYNVTWLPTLLAVMAAVGTFGNFVLNLGVHLRLWN